MPVLGPACPYCPGEHATLQDASVIYGPTYEGRFNLWVCSGCMAYVGAKQGADPAPLGTLANAETRKLRGRLRDAVKLAMSRTRKDKMRRRELGLILTNLMRMQADDCRKALMVLVPAGEEMFTGKEN